MRSAIFLVGTAIDGLTRAIKGEKISRDVAGVYAAVFIMFLLMDLVELSK